MCIPMPFQFPNPHCGPYELPLFFALLLVDLDGGAALEALDVGAALEAFNGGATLDCET